MFWLIPSSCKVKLLSDPTWFTINSSKSAYPDPPETKVKSERTTLPPLVVFIFTIIPVPVEAPCAVVVNPFATE